MKWGQRFRERDDDDADLPEELRGLSPEKIAEKIKAGKDALQLAKDNEAAKLSAEAERDTQKNEFEQIKARLAQVEADPRLKTPQRTQQDDEPASIYTDPEKFIQDQTKGVTQVALAAGIMSAKMYAMQQMPSRDAKIFRKYEKEVETVVASYQPAAQVNPQSWLNALIYVKGLHDVEIAKAESTQTDFFSEGGSGGGNRDEPPAADKLTAEEIEACTKFHWDQAGYLKQKKSMSLSQSEKGAYARFPTPSRTT